MPTVRIKYKQLPNNVLESVRQRRNMGVTYRKMVSEFDIPMHELCKQVNKYEEAISYLAYQEKKAKEEQFTRVEKALKEQTFEQPNLTIGDVCMANNALYCKQSMQPVEYSDIARKYIRVMILDEQIS
jgi:hypothetical protein